MRQTMARNRGLTATLKRRWWIFPIVLMLVAAALVLRAQGRGRDLQRRAPRRRPASRRLAGQPQSHLFPADGLGADAGPPGRSRPGYPEHHLERDRTDRDAGVDAQP